MHLAKKAYDLPPVAFDEKSLSNALEKLYLQSVPQYDPYHPAYNEQLKRLSDIYLHLVKHSTGALAHQNAIRIFFSASFNADLLFWHTKFLQRNKAWFRTYFGVARNKI